MVSALFNWLIGVFRCRTGSHKEPRTTTVGSGVESIDPIDYTEHELLFAPKRDGDSNVVPLRGANRCSWLLNLVSVYRTRGYLSR